MCAAGETTVDGHEMAAAHGIAREHELLRALLSEHLLPPEEMPEAMREAWRRAHVSIAC